MASSVVWTEDQIQKFLLRGYGQIETESVQGLADQLEFAPYDTQPVGAGGLLYGPIEVTRYAYPSGVIRGFSGTAADLTAPAVASGPNMKNVLIIVGVLALAAAAFVFVGRK